MTRGGWGPWRLDAQTRELFCRPAGYGGHTYAVDLDTCTSSAQVLDWIVQVARKEWATPAVTAGLVAALTAVLEPQANLCSWGQSYDITAARIRELVRAATRRVPA